MKVSDNETWTGQAVLTGPPSIIQSSHPQTSFKMRWTKIMESKWTNRNRQSNNTTQRHFLHMAFGTGGHYFVSPSRETEEGREGAKACEGKGEVQTLMIGWGECNETFYPCLQDHHVTSNQVMIISPADSSNRDHSPSLPHPSAR